MRNVSFVFIDCNTLFCLSAGQITRADLCDVTKGTNNCASVASVAFFAPWSTNKALFLAAGGCKQRAKFSVLS